MTETAPETTEAPEVTPAWGSLCRWACDQRRDWDADKVKLAMREAAGRTAGYHDVAVILWRLGWDLKARTREVLGELSNLNRTGPSAGPKDPGPSPEVLAALRAGDYELARRLEGTAPVVPVQRTEAGAQPAETSIEENR